MEYTIKKFRGKSEGLQFSSGRKGDLNLTKIFRNSFHALPSRKVYYFFMERGGTFRKISKVSKKMSMNLREKQIAIVKKGLL